MKSMSIATESSNKEKQVTIRCGGRLCAVFGLLLIMSLIILVYALKLSVTKKSGMFDSEEKISLPDLVTFFPMAISDVNYLIDLTSDPTEANNLFYEATYSSVVLSMLANITKIQSIYGPPLIPSQVNQIATFVKAGGVVPWLETSQEPRVINQKYSYANAPHIVFFLVDDWGYNDAGYQSTYLNWTTPNINKLMRNGVKLTNYYTHELCTPTRAALLTGRYASRFGMNGNTVDVLELPDSEYTMAEEMKSAGYRTYLIGKWHLGYSTWLKTPTYRGFDYFYGYYSGVVDYYNKTDGGFLDLHEVTSLVNDSTEIDHSLHAAFLYQLKAEAAIKNHAAHYANTPMFMYYASQLIHAPFEAPQKFIDLCSDNTSTELQQNYCALNLMLDEVVGNLTCALESNGMLDNTLLVLVSDNGGLPSMSGNSYPWRGGKGSMWRGGSSAAGFIYGGENVLKNKYRGSEYGGLMHVTDWLPTLMSVATNNTWTTSSSNTIDGVNQWESILGSADYPRHEIVHYLTAKGNVSYQYDNYKCVMNAFKRGGFKLPAHYFSPAENMINATTCIADNFPSELSTPLPTLAPTRAPTVIPTITPTGSPTRKTAPPSFTATSVTPTASLKPSYVPTFLPSKKTALPTIVSTTSLPSVSRVPTYVLTAFPSKK